MHWTNVRSIRELREWQFLFEGLPQEEKEEITTEMIMQLALYKERESQTDLFEEKVDHSIAGLELTSQSSRRRRRDSGVAKKRRQRPQLGE